MYSKDLEVTNFLFIGGLSLFCFGLIFSYINYSLNDENSWKIYWLKLITNLITYACFGFSGLFLDFWLLVKLSPIINNLANWFHLKG